MTLEEQADEKELEASESIEEKYRRLLAENKKLKAELSEKKTIINRAKDISPEGRPCSNKRGFGR